MRQRRARFDAHGSGNPAMPGRPAVGFTTTHCHGTRSHRRTLSATCSISDRIVSHPLGQRRNRSGSQSARIYKIGLQIP